LGRVGGEGREGRRLSRRMLYAGVGKGEAWPATLFFSRGGIRKRVVVKEVGAHAGKRRQNRGKGPI